MTENSSRSSKEPTARFQKSVSLNNGRCDTPDSAGSRTGSGSPVSANVAAGSPSSTTSSCAVQANSPTSAPNSNLNHAGGVSRQFSHRGRYGGYGHGHHPYHGGRPNQHASYHPSQCRPSSPPFSKPLLDFMMSQWQTFEISYSRRDHAAVDDGPPASPRISGPANSPYRQPRHGHQGGSWNGANRRFSDNGHHINHTDAGDFQSNSGDMANSGRRFRGPGAHTAHSHQFSNNEQPWQRGHIVGRRKSPNGLPNRTPGPRSSLQFSGPSPASHHHHHQQQHQHQQAQSGVSSTSSPPPPPSSSSSDRAGPAAPLADPAAPATSGGAKPTEGQTTTTESVPACGSSALSERLTGSVVAPKMAAATTSKGRISPSESQPQRQNSPSSATVVGCDALSGGDQFWTPDPPSSPTTASNAPASPNAVCGASAASSSSASSQFFQNAAGQQNASASSGSSPVVERGPPAAAFDKSQQHHHNKQRVSTAPIR
ncbi:hypothetical protein SprV_0602234700 [Sparganum proliferum]